MVAYGSWPAPARRMAVAIDAAVSAATAGDADAFAEANIELRALNREQLVVLLGALTRDVLERSHPDGLDSEGAAESLESCIRFAAGWYQPIDTDALIRALTGALDVAEPDDDADDAPKVDQVAVLTHGLLLIADQLVTLDQELRPVLDTALRELMRAQTIELP